MSFQLKEKKKISGFPFLNKSSPFLWQKSIKFAVRQISLFWGKTGSFSVEELYPRRLG